MKNDNVFDHGRRKMLGSTAKTLAGGMALSLGMPALVRAQAEGPIKIGLVFALSLIHI